VRGRIEHFLTDSALQRLSHAIFLLIETRLGIVHKMAHAG